MCFYLRFCGQGTPSHGRPRRSPPQWSSLAEPLAIASKRARRASAPTVAVEVTLVENRLELEAGVTPLFGPRLTEWDIDFLFKKPWTLSRKAEFMLGVEPEWIHGTGNGVTTNSVGVEVAPDFMFWSSARHRVGWYLEPSYGYSFGRGHEQSVGITGGLLIGILAPAAAIGGVSLLIGAQ